MILKLALAGGLFSILVFIHFFVDWVFQSHAEAMVKHNNPWIRAKHCAIYTLGFIPIMYVCHFTLLEYILSSSILFGSHFIEDTYVPVLLWAKYIRKPPEMTEPWKETYIRADGSLAVKVHPPNVEHGFIEFIKTPLGKILMITIDQIIHIIFLWPVVWLMLRHIS